MAKSNKKVAKRVSFKTHVNGVNKNTLKSKRNAQIKKQKLGKAISAHGDGGGLEFDEESIKKRVQDMLDEYTKQGGKLELEGSDAGSISDDQSEQDEAGSENGATGEPEQDQGSDTDGKADEGTKKDREKQREKRKFDFERNSRTIFVGNLPSNLDHKQVAKLFKECGPVESARIRSVIPEKEKLAPKVALITKRIHPKVDSVNAYVVFQTNENDQCVKKALGMNGKLIDGHHIRVDRASRPMAKRETLGSRKKSIFVGNLRFDLREDDLISHFEKVGPVNYVRIVRDRTTGLGKGFGFVVFQERASVKRALELNDSNFKGRQIRVKKVDEDTKKTKKEKVDKKPNENKPEAESKKEKKKVDIEKNVVKQKKQKIKNKKPNKGPKSQ